VVTRLPPIDRRRLLRGGAALGLTTLVPGRLVRPVHVQTSVGATGVRHWDVLVRQLAGPVLRPGDSAYPHFARPFNLAYDTQDRRPMAVVLCANSADVVTAINWARDNGVPPVARSGGHSYGGFSTTPGLLIDVSLLRGSQWRHGRTLLTIGAGMPSDDLCQLLRAENRTVTHSRCEGVGAAGYVLGGGIGFDMRLLGIASDQLAASHIVTADGEMLHIAHDDNDDLFWACRGAGGGNFGINISFTLNTFPVGSVTVFSIDWTGLRDEVELTAFHLMQALDEAPRALGSRFALQLGKTGAAEATINLLGQFHGPLSLAEALLRPVLSPAAPVTISRKIEELSYWKAQDFLLGRGGPLRFHERSAFLVRPLDQEGFHRALDWLGRWDAHGQPGGFADIHFFQTGGRINEIAAAETAFVHRNSCWLMGIGLIWPETEPPERIADHRRWQDEFYAAMLPDSNGEAYQNFADPALRDWNLAYYGSNLARLRQIKAKYDRHNIFRFAQSIPPS
jgi:hypothetical protein